MSKLYRSQLGRRALVVMLLVIVLSVVGTSAFAAVKQFSLVLTPGSAGAGTTQSYSGTITNESGSTLDTVTISVPSSASIPGFKILSATGGTVSQAGDSVTYTGLGLGNGSSTTVSFQAVTTCGTGPFSWSATGKASNNQPFTLDAGTSSVATTLTGACSLAISRVGSAEKNAVISTVDYTTPGTPVTVQLLDSGGSLMTSVTGPEVDLTLAPNPTALGGGAANLSGGVATYTSLNVTKANFSYTLTPSMPANTSITGASSNTFQIWDKDKKCNANSPCAGTYLPPTGLGDLTTTATATFTSDTGILISYDVQTSPCPADSYNHLGQVIGGTLVPTAVTVQTEGQELPSGAWVTTFYVSKAADQFQPQNGARFYHLCLMTRVQFTTLDGTLATPCNGTDCPVGFFYGLVQNAPHCTDPQPNACLLSANKTKAGVVILVLQLPPGDPLHH